LLPFIGTSQRIVFQWQNTAGLFSNTAASPAASIDDIAITQNTSYSYSWTSVPAGFTSTSQSPSVSPTVNTTYNLTTTRCDGCSNTASATVTMCAASPIPVANFSSSDTTICVGSCINFTDLSSNTPTSWAWTFAGAATPTSTQQNPVGICYNTAGSYNVTLVATNANGSGTIVKNLFINVINNPTIVVSPNATSICNGSSDTLVASGANTYTWLPATALNTTIGNTVIANPTSTTTYTVTGTSSGCSNIATVQVTVNNPPTLAMSSISASCGMSNGSATVNPTGGNTPYSYSWSTSPVQNTATAANIPAGSYTVTVNDANFCSTTGTVNVSNSSGPTLTSSSVNATCGMSNGSATVTPTGGTLPYSYSWNTSPIQTTAIASNIPSGSYTVTVSDGSSCSAITTVVVGGTSGPSLSSSFTDATCGLSDGSATAIPSGGTLPYSYNWNTSPVQTTVTALNIPAGTYTVTVSDGNSCTATTTVTINNIGGPTVSISGNNSTCGLANGDATVNPIGGTSPYTYLWNTSPAQSTQTASNLPAGTYSVTVTDAGSCNATTTIVITTSPNPIATAGTIIPSECGQSNGSATIIASSGMGPYTYSWNTVPPQSTATITNVPTGTYIVTITDANSCSQTQTVSIGSTGGPTATITPNIVTIHSGDIVSLTASGGVNYSWTPSVGLSCNNCPNPVASPTVSTVYCVLVSDANNCSDTACASVLLEILCGEVFIPSAFSPNNDNSNDVLYIRGNCITTMEFAIFDRWGEKVFETTDVVNGWDGKYKGQLMNSQVFVYYLTATLLNGEQIKRQGNISLVR
ncbi:MAG: gliding motility-associated C-terminal domain-containing protein, partial [Bacteroidetes bacterium]|nr:gliding motility-associated C-terminal domain-containing protein [Bacteroidota bacterium]